MRTADNKQPVREDATETTPAGAPPHRPRLPYAPPRIESLGDLRSVVLGASIGTPDTANPNTGFNP